MAFDNTYFSTNAPTNYAALKTAMEAYETEQGISGRSSRKCLGLACAVEPLLDACKIEAAAADEAE